MKNGTILDNRDPEKAAEAIFRALYLGAKCDKSIELSLQYKLEHTLKRH